MASSVKKTKPMPKIEIARIKTMRAQAEIHAAQILAFKHGIVWGIAEVIWSKFSDEDFDPSEIGHWQGAGYRVIQEATSSALDFVKQLPALATKYIGVAMSGGSVLPPV